VEEQRFAELKSKASSGALSVEEEREFSELVRRPEAKRQPTGGRVATPGNDDGMATITAHPHRK
jgi:hypothetical protein